MKRTLILITACIFSVAAVYGNSDKENMKKLKNEYNQAIKELKKIEGMYNETLKNIEELKESAQTIYMDHKRSDCRRLRLIEDNIEFIELTQDLINFSSLSIPAVQLIFNLAVLDIITGGLNQMLVDVSQLTLNDGTCTKAIQQKKPHRKKLMKKTEKLQRKMRHKAKDIEFFTTIILKRCNGYLLTLKPLAASINCSE